MGVNPNSISASFAKIWSRSMQLKVKKSTVYNELGNSEAKAGLVKGNTFSKEFRSDFVVNDMGADGSYATQGITDTEETLIIDKEKEVSFYIKDLDKLQSNYDTVKEYTNDAGARLAEQVDGDFIKIGTLGAGFTVDDSNLGGTSGNGITHDSSNALKVLQKIKLAMNANNITAANRWGVISSEFEDSLTEALGDKETTFGDDVSESGKISGKIKGFQLYVNNSCYSNYKLLIGTNASESDTVTINGVVFTFNATPSGAGSVDIGTTAPGDIANLVLAINGGAVGSTYIALSAADRIRMKGITATAVSGGITLAVTGKSYIAVSEVLTAPADVWTPALQIQECMFGQGKPENFVIQKDPKVQDNPVTGKIGKDIITWMVYGGKVFHEGSLNLVRVKLRSDAY